MTHSAWLWPSAIAALAAALVLATIDAAGDHPGGREGPGLTVDEALNVAQGVHLADRLISADLAGFRALDRRMPDYPPLGRLWLGLCHEVAFLVAPPLDSNVPYSITCARSAPALAFALTVFLVGWAAGRWYGNYAGAIAALSLILMPRIFGHAHIASLESCIDLAYAATVLYLADRWSKSNGSIDASRAVANRPNSEPAQGPRYRTALIGGVLFGLALLIKIQAVLLPIPISLWALVVLRRRALILLPVFGLTGLLVLFTGWPFLWDAPLSNLRQYLGRSTERVVIYAWYGGQAVADRDLPWHYPWVMWLTTVPFGLHLLGVVGAWRSLSDASERPRAILLLACLSFPLVLFSLPGVVVYDGERLFSISFPLWGLFIGCGAHTLRQAVTQRLSPTVAGAVLGALLAAQSWGLFQMAPCWLSYYNLSVGGLRGAERLGLPVTYWGDGMTRRLIAATAEIVPRGSTIAVAPVLYPNQWDELILQSPMLREHEVTFVPLDSAEAADCEMALFFPRREYLPDELRGPLDPDRIVAAVRRDGVVLAVLYRIR
jgi:hypothetical protein